MSEPSSSSQHESPQMRVSPWSIYLFQAFGIRVYLHASWFILAVLFVQFIAIGMFDNSMWAALAYVTLFAIVLLHEFGHALAAKSVGGLADQIVLWPLGGIAFVKPPPRPGATLWTIAAGPLVNVALVPVTLAALFATAPELARAFPFPERALVDSATDLQTFVYMVASMNLLLLVFNMLPVYPLDGGQIFQSLLWFVVGRARSLLIAARVGLAGAVVIGAGGFLVLGSVWFLVLAGFVALQAWEGMQLASQMVRYERMRTGE